MKINLKTEEKDGSKIFQNTKPGSAFHVGDCTLAGFPPDVAPQNQVGPIVTFNPDGTGKFTGYGLSADTHDTWQWRLEAVNQAGKVLKYLPGDPLVLGGQLSYPIWEFEMDDNNRWYYIDQNFNYDHALLPDIESVNMHCNC